MIRIVIASVLICIAPAKARDPLLGEFFDRSTFPNPYAHIPAQCYGGTMLGAQNSCLFCHTNGVYEIRLGNNNPQAGHEPVIGDLQLTYSLPAHRFPFGRNGSVNPWENTLRPERLARAVAEIGVCPESWNMTEYIRQDNWHDAFKKRPGSPRDWDGGEDSPYRMFPGLDPADLPAAADGFVRSSRPSNGLFRDEEGWLTGWRAVNFMPYGIFTPHTGSVSGVYIRLPSRFMRDGGSRYDLNLYECNLDLLERAIQDRLLPGESSHYFGEAGTVRVERGLYPVGTEFAHPLHYVDVRADGSDKTVSPFPGTRGRRLKEMRYLYKIRRFEPSYVRPGEKDEDAPVYASVAQGWIDNGAGWLLAGFIERKDGCLRPQTPSELTQCVGCHSGSSFQADVGPGDFTSGTGNTVDSTWAFPRKFPGDSGWCEMDYLGFRAVAAHRPNCVPGASGTGDPLNRLSGKGELRTFLDHGVGVDLFGEMPFSIERELANSIREDRGYEDDWPAVDEKSIAGLRASVNTRQALLREMTRRRDYLDDSGFILGVFLYPWEESALESARRYRQIVVTQRFDLGKTVFAKTPMILRYYREPGDGFAHQDGTPYKIGELLTDRPVDEDPANITYGIGISSTLIDPMVPFVEGGTYLPNYVPLLRVPLAFERKESRASCRQKAAPSK